jgi:hypothetical protein
VVRTSRIDGWLAELRAAGLQPEAIYCESQLLPAMPGQLIALLDGESLILRTAEGVPLIMPARSIRDAFEMTLATQASQVAGLEPRRSDCCCTWATRTGRRAQLEIERCANASPA